MRRALPSACSTNPAPRSDGVEILVARPRQRRGLYTRRRPAHAYFVPRRSRGDLVRRVCSTSRLSVHSPWTSGDSFAKVLKAQPVICVHAALAQSGGVNTILRHGLEVIPEERHLTSPEQGRS